MFRRIFTFAIWGIFLCGVVFAGDRLFSGHIDEKIGVSTSYSQAKRVAALNTGGRNRGQYLGLTSSSYTGNLGGIAGANAKCQADYGAGSHMCTQGEALRSGGSSFGSGFASGWIACTLYHVGHQGQVGPTYFWGACANITTELKNPEPGGGTTWNCSQWTSAASDQRGPGMDLQGSIQEQSCSLSRPIHCCV